MATMHMLAESFNKFSDQTVLNEPVQFYFDQQSEKSALFSVSDEFLSSQGEGVRRLIKSPPRFEDDEKYLPLQSADLWAWWVREWHVGGTPQQLNRPNFGSFVAAREDHLKLDLQVTADHIGSVFASICRKKAAE